MWRQLFSSTRIHACISIGQWGTRMRCFSSYLGQMDHSSLSTLVEEVSFLITKFVILWIHLKGKQLALHKLHLDSITSYQFNLLLTQGWLYVQPRVGPSTGRPNPQSLTFNITQLYQLLLGPILSHVEVTRPDIGLDVLLEESLVRRVNFPWIIGKDVHYPTNESNPVHGESPTQGKPHPNFFSSQREELTPNFVT